MQAEADPATVKAAGATVLDGSNDGVRAALRQLMAGSVLNGLETDARGKLEIVLAEVLNNIVEHAYRDESGPISLHLWRAGALLQVLVEDRGHPMPDGAPPQGAPPMLDSPDGPPEGGFGWFLIRNLTEELTYDRKEGVNRLCFALRVND